MSAPIVVIGLGEIGRPLLELIGQHYDAVGIDVQPSPFRGPCQILHICYPFQIDDFIGATARYIERFAPELTIVNSSVPPGTSRAILRATDLRPLVYSPVRGKHARMQQDLLAYTKFVGGLLPSWSHSAAAHFASLGMRTQILPSAETAELAKLAETTYFALLVAWAQEVERYCDALDVDYDSVTPMFDEIAYLPPVRFFPGVIGGHCLLPNIKLLKKVFHSDLLDAIERSNALKEQREANQDAVPHAAANRRPSDQGSIASNGQEGVLS
jgi:UDP-N-acetyl-D-mannosaminuronate dehydrogenase